MKEKKIKKSVKRTKFCPDPPQVKNFTLFFSGEKVPKPKNKFTVQCCCESATALINVYGRSGAKTESLLISSTDSTDSMDNIL